MKTDGALVDTALLASRLVVGSSLAAHGAQKYYGWFNGAGFEATSIMMESLGFRPGNQFATANALTEMSSGTLMALGALGPIGPAMMLSVMLVATETVHKKNGYFTQDGGFELNTLYAVAGLLLANFGYGTLSFDRVTGFSKLQKPWLAWLTLAGGILGGLSMLALRGPRAESKPELAKQGALENDPEAAKAKAARP